MGQKSPVEGGHDAVVDAPHADGGVGQVDHGVAAAVQGGQRGAHGDGLAGGATLRDCTENRSDFGTSATVTWAGIGTAMNL